MMSTAEGGREQFNRPNVPPSPISVGLYDSYDGTSSPGMQQESNYQFIKTEDYIISFLIEKAVAMREVPFMKATDALEFSTNLTKVQSELQQLLPRENKRGQNPRRRHPGKPLD